MTRRSQSILSLLRARSARRQKSARTRQSQHLRRLPVLAVLLTLTLLFAAEVHSARSMPASAQQAFGGAQPETRQLPAQFTHVLHVPVDFATIQQAVDAAQANDLVLVAPGVYHEAVLVRSAGITIRGEDRNATILDGDFKPATGFTVRANNVVIENMTARNFGGNGFYWRFVQGYRGSYLTAYNNGDYGIYAFGSVRGQFDHSYASGSPDSGFYIGQCFPCDALITNVHAQYNALGYSGTNAGGNLIIRDSEWDHNGAGIMPNSLDSEKLAPEHGATIVQNFVHDNGNTPVPALPLEYVTFGVGIGMPGGDLNYVANNRLERNSAYGILVSGIIDDNFWLASGNVIEHNSVKDSGIADLALSSPSGAGNCFSTNDVQTTLPPLLETTHACDTPLPLSGGGDFGITKRLLARFIFAKGPDYHSLDYRTMAPPPPQENMPDVNSGPANVFTMSGFKVDHSNGALPAGVRGGGSVMLLPLGSSGYSLLQLLTGLPGASSLLAVYLAWIVVAIWELSRRREISGGRRLGMGVLVAVVPLVGPLIYYFSGMSKLDRGTRLALVLGGPVLCLLATILLLVASGITAAG